MEQSSTSKSRLWISWVLSGIAILFLLFDSTIHILAPQPVIDSCKQLGFPLETIQALGIVQLICLVLYVIPRTAVFGAVLMTGWLGGAMALQFRIGAPLLSTALSPVYVGVLLWGGLYLRENRVAALIPFRGSETSSGF